MKIGIIGAMEEEIALLRKKIKQCQNISIGKCEIYTGLLHDIEIVLVKSGIGKVLASLGTTLLLERFEVNTVINIGSAGGILPTLKIGDVIIVNESRYHDVDMTILGYEYGQIAGYPVTFKSNAKLIMAVESCINNLRLHAVHGLIVSGDTFIRKDSDLVKLRDYFPEAIAVEMESAAIFHICYNFNIPVVGIRAISDLPDQKSESYLKFFKNSLPTAVARYSLVVESLLQKLTCN